MVFFSRTTRSSLSTEEQSKYVRIRIGVFIGERLANFRSWHTNLRRGLTRNINFSITTRNGPRVHKNSSLGCTPIIPSSSYIKENLAD